MIAILLLLMRSLFLLQVLAHDKVVQDWYSLVLTQLNEVECWDLHLVILEFVREINDFSVSFHL